MKIIYQLRANLFELRKEFWHRKNYGSFFICTGLFFCLFFVVNNLMFDTFFSTKTAVLTIVIALIWTGIFNSVSCICSIRGKVKIQHIQGMTITSFVIANVIFQFCICFIQSVIVSVLYYAMIDYPKEGISSPAVIEYFIIILLITFSSDMLGLLVSSFSQDNEKAMTYMPMVLVTELICSNALFDLPEIWGFDLRYITFGMISRLGIDAFGTIANMMSLDQAQGLQFECPDILYTYTSGHLMQVEAIILGWSLVYIVITVIRLSFINREQLF